MYAVTLVHSQERNLLSRQDIEQLIAAPDVQAVFRMLTDKGWGAADTPADDAAALIAVETAKTWNLIEELAGDLEAFNVFRYANDFHNLKAAIKLAYTGALEEDTGGYYVEYGTVDLEKIVEAAKSHDFSSLPADMAAAGMEAYEVLAHSGNGQACDMVIDRAALLAVDKAGKAQKESELLRRYAEITVDAANIKAAVRCRLMEKDEEFIEKAVAPAGSLDTDALKKAAAEDMEAVYACLLTTAYAGAVDALKKSMAAFERWCDDVMIEMIRPQRFNYFTIEPLAAFILGRENEIRMVRLVLSAKINELGEDALRERLRELYV